MALSRAVKDTERSTSSATCTTASITLSTDDLLVVRVAASKFSEAFACTGVTWNGNALTLAVGLTGTPGAQAGWHHSSIWYYKVTSGASATVVATCSDVNEEINVVAVSYTGHDTTTPIGDTDSTQQNNGSGIAPSLTLTAASGDEVVDALTTHELVSIGADQTEDYGVDIVWDDHFSYQSATGTSEVMSWTITSDRGYVFTAAVIKAAAGGGGGSAIAPLMYYQNLLRRA